MTGRMKSDYMYSVGVVYNTSQCNIKMPTCQSWSHWLRPYSTPAPPIRTQHWPTSTIRLHVLRSPKSPPSPRPCRRPALSPYRVRIRTREGRAPLHALRENECPFESRDASETKTTPRAAKSDRFGVVTVVHCITNCRSGVDDERSSCGRTALPH